MTACAVDPRHLEQRHLYRTGMRKVPEGRNALHEGPRLPRPPCQRAVPAAPTSTAAVILVGVATTSSLMEREGGELMTVVETIAVRGARIILTSRASS